jgi:hypothetical protein
LSIHVQKLSKLKSGKECDGFVTLVSGADFDGMIVVLLAFLNSEALCSFPLKRHDWFIK